LEDVSKAELLVAQNPEAAEEEDDSDYLVEKETDDIEPRKPKRGYRSKQYVEERKNDFDDGDIVFEEAASGALGDRSQKRPHRSAGWNREEEGAVISEDESDEAQQRRRRRRRGSEE